jgi:hypothetical protein
MIDDIDLQRIAGWTPDRIAFLDTDILARLGRELADAKASLTDVEARLGVALDYKFGEEAREQRLAEGKDSGRVRLDDGDFVILADQPKRVEWDQQALATVVARIRDAGDDPAEYVKTKLEVSERAYGAWPQRIRAIFEPARTVKLGKPSYTIERLQAEAA